MLGPAQGVLGYAAEVTEVHSLDGVDGENVTVGDCICGVTFGRYHHRSLVVPDQLATKMLTVVILLYESVSPLMGGRCYWTRSNDIQFV